MNDSELQVTVVSSAKRSLFWKLSISLMILIILVLIAVLTLTILKSYFPMNDSFIGDWSSSSPINSKMTIIEKAGGTADICYEWRKGKEGGYGIYKAKIMADGVITWGELNERIFKFYPRSDGGFDGQSEYNGITSKTVFTKLQMPLYSYILNVITHKDILCDKLDNG